MTGDHQRSLCRSSPECHRYTIASLMTDVYCFFFPLKNEAFVEPVLFRMEEPSTTWGWVPNSHPSLCYREKGAQYLQRGLRTSSWNVCISGFLHRDT